MQKWKMSRRGFLLRTAAVAVGWVAFGAERLFASGSLPAGKTAVSASDPMGKSLKYVEDVSKADKAKFPMRKPDQTCKNCAFYKKLNEGWGDCTLLKSGVVSVKGYCISWSPK